jgi:hypothetical protein
MDSRPVQDLNGQQPPQKATAALALHRMGRLKSGLARLFRDSVNYNMPGKDEPDGLHPRENFQFSQTS